MNKRLIVQQKLHFYNDFCARNSQLTIAIFKKKKHEQKIKQTKFISFLKKIH